MSLDKNKKAQIWGGITGVLLVIAIFLGIQARKSLSDLPAIKTPQGISFTASGISGLGNNESFQKNALPYSNTAYKFTVQYPKDFIITSFEEGEGDMILFQKSKEAKGFQIYITSFDEGDITLTKERVQKDIPSQVINNPEQISIAGKKVGLAFTTNETREVWFVHSGYLYQISTPLVSEALLLNVLATWQFAQ